MNTGRQVVIFAPHVLTIQIDQKVMSKLIWQLYNDNLISEEVANLLLDKHFNRLEHKRYK
tara:strand:- start:594 stop:773 length:180 start_codon:yes stop_codon:yes gene_type:complete